MNLSWDLQALAGSLHFIPLLPLLGAAFLGLAGRRLGTSGAALVGCGTVFGSAVLSALVLVPLAAPGFFANAPPALAESLGTWFAAGPLSVEVSLRADVLSATLALVVSGVGFLIHLYSTEYMHDDEGFARYFAYLNLFVAFMLVLVLANDLVLLFVGWEGVGLCSYLLIGFWYEDDAKASAGRKAFVVNRIGDFGFLLGLFAIFALFGTFVIVPLDEAAPALAPMAQEVRGLMGAGGVSPLGIGWQASITAVCLLLFVGVTGKSAQLPLYVWLPDAMAGPTPVSALIHAATMVTAGVYLIARLSFLFALSPLAMAVVAMVGAVTAIFAAMMAFAQTDIKKVLAYSTVSQLGLMVIGVGLGAWWQGVFHLVTHAFFKALLFLGAGAVILGCHHEQDVRKMGGLARRMPQTALTFLIGTLAITGVLPLSGFFSKDAIIHAAGATRLQGFEWVGPAASTIGTVTALFTAFYMFRLYFLVFSGAPRSDAAGHASERRAAMTAPLWILALLSVVALLWGWPWAPFAVAGPGGAHEPLFAAFTAPAFALGRAALPAPEEHGGLATALGVALAVAWAGFLLAWVLYRRGGIARLEPFFARGPGRIAYRVVANKFYVDEIYDLLIVSPFKLVASLAWQVVDVFAIDTLGVRGVARLTAWAGAVLRYAQNGDVQRYAAVLALAAVALFWAVM